MFKELNRELISKWEFLKLEKINLEWWRVYETAWRVWWKNAVAGLVRNIENQSYILIEQYRYPVKSKVLELVAWVVDKSSSLEQIMREEVYEETGYNDIRNIEQHSLYCSRNTNNKYFFCIDPFHLHIV